MIHNADKLEALAQRMGLLPFFACGIPNFSIEDFTPEQFWFEEGVDGPWEWRMDVARRGVVAYGKLFNKKAGLVSREWYPDLANYRRDGYDFDARYEDGLRCFITCNFTPPHTRRSCDSSLSDCASYRSVHSRFRQCFHILTICGYEPPAYHSRPPLARFCPAVS